MSIGLVSKIALITTMVIVTAVWEDGGFVPVGSCPYRDTFSCCVYSCQHDSSTGCSGGVRCCENLCR